MDKEIKTRLGWVELYRETGNAGLRSRGRRPKPSPNQKRTPTLEERILMLRKKRNLGARRIQSDLLWEDDIRLSLGTIHKVLINAEVGPLKRPRAANTACATNVPYPAQRVQTDQGPKFFACKVQGQLMNYGIKFRPIRPASPHLNGKVERSQKTDKIEFYALCDLEAPGLEDRLSEWQHYYIWRRPHGALKGKTPIQRATELMKDTPYWDDVSVLYDPTKEQIKERNYRVDLQLRELKGCP